MTRQNALETPETQSLVIDLDANDVATIAVSDILANVADADPATFSLAGASTKHGSTVELEDGEVTYTGDPVQGWDRFEYEVCELGDASACATGGQGGDGLLFFMVDGDEVEGDDFELGGCCGSLGYAPYITGSENRPGMPHAVAGIAFDS